MQLGLMRLEERIVLDAAGADEGDNPDGGTPAPVTPAPDAAADAGDGVHVLVVSDQIDNADELADAAMDNVRTVLYDAGQDSPEQLLSEIAETLAGDEAASIGFATHDLGPGRFHLTGRQIVDFGTLLTNPQMQAFWQGVGELVAEGGRVDLLPCDFASVDSGENAVALIEGFAGVNVAASNDVTGNAEAGGDWILETDNVDLTQVYFDAGALASFEGRLGIYNDLDPSAGDVHDVAIDGDIAVVGSSYFGGAHATVFIGTDTMDSFGNTSGDADFTALDGVYDTWTETIDLASLIMTGSPSLNFGTTVAVEDNVVVVADTTGQMLYTFERSGATWTFEDALAMPAVGFTDYAVALENVGGKIYMAVGISEANWVGVFDQSPTLGVYWDSLGTMSADQDVGSGGLGLSANSDYGYAVDIAGSAANSVYVLVGAPAVSGGTNPEAYLMWLDSGNSELDLVGAVDEGGEAGSWFGYDVALDYFPGSEWLDGPDGTDVAGQFNALVGAPKADINYGNDGDWYFYSDIVGDDLVADQQGTDNWNNGFHDDNMGWSVALDDWQAIVGARGQDNSNTTYYGAVHCFWYDPVDFDGDGLLLEAGVVAEAEYAGTQVHLGETVAVDGESGSRYALFAGQDTPFATVFDSHAMNYANPRVTAPMIQNTDIWNVDSDAAANHIEATIVNGDIDENGGAAITVATFTLEDTLLDQNFDYAEWMDEYQFKLTDDFGGKFVLSVDTNGTETQWDDEWTIKTNGTFDYETQDSYNIEVDIVDSGDINFLDAYFEGDAAEHWRDQTDAGDWWNDAWEVSVSVVPAFTINDVNEAPTVTLPGTQTTTENTALVLSTANGNLVTVGDVDAEADVDGSADDEVEVTITLQDTEGTAGGDIGALTLGGVAGLAFTDAQGDESMTFTGLIADVNAALDGLTFTPTANYYTNSNRTAQIQITIDDQDSSGGGPAALQDTETLNVNVTSDQDGAATLAMNGAEGASFAEGGAAVLIDSNTTVNDDADEFGAGNVVDFGGGSLTVSFGGGTGTTDDRLTIADTGAANIDVDGSNVTYTVTGDVIGTWSGGTDGATPLVISFNDDATEAAVQAVARSIYFSNVSEDPNTTQREITYTVVDRDGGGNSDAAFRVDVTSTNDAPVLGGFGGAATLTEDQAPAYTILNPNATVTDVDTTDFQGGTLTVSGNEVADGEDLNVVDGINGITVAGVVVSYSGTAIGQITTDGQDGDDLVVTFNQGNPVSAAAAQALMRSISFDNDNDQNPTAETQAITFVFNDGDDSHDANDNADSAPGTVDVTVVAVNDAPVVAMPGGGFAAQDEDAAAWNVHAGGWTLTDVDSGGNDITVVLSVGNGVLNVVDGPGTLSAFTTGAASVQLVGTAAEIQAVLQGGGGSSITYDSDLNFNGTETLQVTVNDGGNSGTGGALTDSESATITIDPVNDAPTDINNVTLAEDGLGSGTVQGGGVIAQLVPDDVDNRAPSASANYQGLNGYDFDVTSLVFVSSTNDEITDTASLNAFFTVADNGELTLAADKSLNVGDEIVMTVALDTDNWFGDNLGAQGPFQFTLNVVALTPPAEAPNIPPPQPDPGLDMSDFSTGDVANSPTDVVVPAGTDPSDFVITAGLVEQDTAAVDTAFENAAETPVVTGADLTAFGNLGTTLEQTFTPEVTGFIEALTGPVEGEAPAENADAAALLGLSGEYTQTPLPEVPDAFDFSAIENLPALLGGGAELSVTELTPVADALVTGLVTPEFLEASVRNYVAAEIDTVYDDAQQIRTLLDLNDAGLLGFDQAQSLENAYVSLTARREALLEMATQRLGDVDWNAQFGAVRGLLVRDASSFIQDRLVLTDLDLEELLEDEIFLAELQRLLSRRISQLPVFGAYREAVLATAFEAREALEASRGELIEAE